MALRFLRDGYFVGNVGIGTTSPNSSVKLQVEETGSNAYIRIVETGNTGLDIGQETVGNAIINLRDNKDLRLFTNGSEAVRIKNTGNVGIGTNSPTANLHVTGSSSSANLPIAKIESTGNISYLKFFNSSTGTGSSDGTYIGMNGGTAYLINKEAGNLYLGTGDDINLTLQNGGNVGIGTTSPGEKLAVKGDASYIEITHPTATSYSGIKFSEGGTPQGSIQNIGSTFATVARRGNFEIFHNTGGNLTLQHSGGNVGIGTTSPGYKLDVESGTTPLHLNRTGGATALIGLDIAGVNRGLIGATTTAAFVSYSSAAASLMTVLNTGNVGIGTTSPVNKQQNKYTSVAINSMTATAGTASTNWNRNAGLLIEESNSSNGLALGVSQTANDRKSWIQSGHPGSAANNLGVLSLNPLGGNVGIGTTSPLAKLNIESPLGSDIAFRLTQTSKNWWEFKNTGGTNDLNLSDAFGTYVTFKNGGNVGIGTTSPNDILQVNQGSAAFRGITIEGTSPALYLKDTQATNAHHIGSNGNYLYFLEDSNQSGGYNNIMAFWDPSNNFIFSLGNVGIGTTAPTTKLHVNGDIRIQGENELYFGGTGSVPHWEITASGSDLIVNDTGTNVGSVLFNNDEGVALPRLTTTQINAISSPTQGLMAYNTTLNTICFYNGSSWQKVNHANM